MLPLVFVGLIAAPTTAQRYVVEELPAISSFPARAFDLNGAGVAVGHGLSPTLQQHALLWQGAFVIDLTPSNPLAEAAGVSEGGLVAGWARNASGATEAVRWTLGVPAFLGMLPGHVGSFAQDLSDGGLVAGWSVTPVGDPVAAVWTDGAIQAIGPAPSWAFAVSETGDVAGHRWIGVDKQGFRWRAGTLDVLPHLGVGYVSAVGISPAGRIAGSAASPATGLLHGVVWDQDLAVTDLGLFLGTFGTAATDTNDAGVTVGVALDAQGDVFAALVWRGAGAEELDALVPPGSGWSLRDAQAVNERGEIVGFGLRAGTLRPFRLLPDCDGDGLSDLAEIAAGTEHDSNGDGLADACQHCQEDLGFGGPGALQLSICGDVLVGPASAATLALVGSLPGAPLILAAGLEAHPTSLLGGVLVPVPPLVVLPVQHADAMGALAFPIHGVAAPRSVLYVQGVGLSGAKVLVSNALRVELGVP
jgi:uncharacterized membrane protein